jgi:hypothetical protein
VELRVERDPADALATLRAIGVASADAFAIGTTLTVPLHHTTAAAAVSAASPLARSISTRRPTLDDVYLRLTGDRLAEAA